MGTYHRGRLFYYPKVDGLLLRMHEDYERSNVRYFVQWIPRSSVASHFVGQAPFGALARIREAQANSVEDAVHVVTTVRGRSSATLAVSPASQESAPCVVAVLESALTAGQLAQVVYISTDDPSSKLHSSLE